MKKLVLLIVPICILGLTGCHRDQKPSSTSDQTAAYNFDNTGINKRDRNNQNLTTFDQSESEADRSITRRVRQVIVGEPGLSNNARNIKIITVNGVVTLRGPVSNEREKDIIANKTGQISGVNRVDNQLEVSGR